MGRRNQPSLIGNQPSLIEESTVIEQNKSIKEEKNLREAQESDFEEESFVGEEDKPRKKKGGKYPNAEKVFSLFVPMNPMWRRNTTQLEAAENLFKLGVENCKVRIDFFNEHRADKFCPRILSPYDLEKKWLNLFDYKKTNHHGNS
jgi:hypothetical protein